jgi:hypothetical protein
VGVALLAFALFFAPVAVGRTGAELDRAAQTLTAHGAAAADLRAPSAAIARVKAERQARTQAEKKLAAALVELGAGEDLDALGRLVSSATADARYGSDGSVELTLTLPTKELELKKPKRHKKAADKE